VLFPDKLETDAGPAGSPDWPWTGGLLSQSLDSLNCKWMVILSFRCVFVFWMVLGGGGTGKNWFLSRETRSGIKKNFLLVFGICSGTGTELRKNEFEKKQVWLG
jgi:hypothetical protein